MINPERWRQIEQICEEVPVARTRVVCGSAVSQELGREPVCIEAADLHETQVRYP